ncbi:MAG: tRNA pseudouridine(38-40) synthase TruA [Clostridia bacterium]|nr:tRNA pseudouridine(38-40) synthase TruA [Clostridia bacterium]
MSKHRPSAADHPAEGLKRFFLIVEYDGTDYCGWQRQQNGPSVQQALEEALSRLTGEVICVTGSSRTDAGVHAMGLCAHFDSATRIPPEKIAFALNTMLPSDIRVRESGAALEGFHARYGACGKVYRYRFFNSRHDCAIGRQYAAHVPLLLNVELMNREAQALIGTHDFEAFAASGSVVKSTVRTIYRAQVTRSGDEVTLLVLGDGFLYNMVRIIAGTLMEIGTGKREPGAIAKAIETKDRLALGQTAPAKGLTLMRVLYGGDEEIALSYFE